MCVSTEFSHYDDVSYPPAIGNGILISMAQVILLTIYPMDRIGAIMGWYGLSITAAPVIAPTLAGMIVDKLNWHAIFYIVGAIVFVSLIWALNVFEDVLDVTKKNLICSPFTQRCDFWRLHIRIRESRNLWLCQSPCLGCIARRFDWRHLICPPPNESGSALLGSAGPQNERVCAKCVWEYFTLSCFNGLFNADTLVCTIHSWKICNNLRVGGIARFVSFCLFESYRWPYL